MSYLASLSILMVLITSCWGFESDNDANKADTSTEIEEAIKDVCWSSMSKVDSPIPRGESSYSATWSGNQFVLIGKYFDDPGDDSKVVGGIYDPAVDSWTKVVTPDDFPIDAKLIAAGGLVYALRSDKLIRYDLGTASWQVLAPPPAEASFIDFVFAGDSQIHFVSKLAEGCKTCVKVFTYSPEANKWNASASQEVGGLGYKASANAEKILVSIKGQRESLLGTYLLDLASGTWDEISTSKKPFSAEFLAEGKSFIQAGYIESGGGSFQQSHKNRLWYRLDVLEKKWKKINLQVDGDDFSFATRYTYLNGRILLISDYNDIRVLEGDKLKHVSVKSNGANRPPIASRITSSGQRYAAMTSGSQGFGDPGIWGSLLTSNCN